MTRRAAGLALVVGGVGLLVLGLIGFLSKQDDSTDAAATPVLPSAPPERATTTLEADTTPPPPPISTTPTTGPMNTTSVPTTSTTTTTSPPPPPPPTTADPNPDVEAFVDAFAAAVRAGDSSFLLAALHPAVFEVYGREACEAYVPGVIDTDLELVVREFTGPETWDWVIDGGATEIENAVAVEVSRVEGGQTIIQELHFAVVEGTLRWFTDCGDRLG